MTEMIRHAIGRDSMYKVWHRSGRNMILYVHKGVGSIVTQETVFPLYPGTLCFVGSQVYHHTFPDLSFAYDRSKVFVDDSLLKLMAASLEKEVTPHSIIYGEVDEDIESVFQLMEKYGVAGGYLQLLSILHGNTDRGSCISESSVDQGIGYIQKHAAEHITIDDICGHIHASKFHFCRKFKERTGYTVMKYVLKTRIALACTMIEQNRYNIGQIGEKCGFLSHAHFSRVFKGELGMSPAQYKKTLAKNKNG